MDSVSIGQALMALAGTALLTVGGSWVAVKVALAKLQQRQEGFEQQQSATEQRVTRLEDATDERMTRLEAKVDRMVTEEEFQALAGQTTEGVNRLTEKVGRFAGLVEGWSRSERR